MYYIKKQIDINELNRKAKLYIGLPDDYEKSQKRYPVLYVHDAHNVFSKEDSYIGVTWGLMEAYEMDPNLPELIVVGLDCANGWDRLDEYGPFEINTNKFGLNIDRKVGGKGDIYLDYLVNHLKPSIDEKYRTLPDKEYTGIMGSSMGGLISTYAASKYNNVFTRIGALSGSYFVSLAPLLSVINQTDFSNIQRYYMDIGTKEEGLGHPQDYLESNQAVYEVLKNKIPSEKLKYEIIENAIHNETEWAKRLPSVLKFIFS